MNDDIKAIRDALAEHVTFAAAPRTFSYDTEAWHAACSPDRIARLLAALEDAQKWRGLYLRAINEANGLTNYVEERPELTRAERRLAAIESEARTIAAAMTEGK